MKTQGSAVLLAFALIGWLQLAGIHPGPEYSIMIIFVPSGSAGTSHVCFTSNYAVELMDNTDFHGFQKPATNTRKYTIIRQLVSSLTFRASG